MLRSIVMNADRAISMSDRRTSIRRTGVRGIHAASALLLAGLLAFSAIYALPVAAPPQHGGSVHAKNAATPDWIVERQTQNAHQAPVVIEVQEPSFWI
jgi:hypothetical protein